MSSHTQRLREANSEISPFFTSVTNSHKTYMLSGRDTSSTIIVRMIIVDGVEAAILTSVGRKNEEFKSVFMVCVTKLLRRKKKGGYKKSSDKDTDVRITEFF